jgi:hypothetical protein
MSEPQFYWCGWNVPMDLPQEDWAESWPPGMQGWCSGEGASYTTWVGAVWAETPEEAWEVVQSCYGASGGLISERWEPKPQGVDYEPGDRFPGFKAAELKVGRA